MRKKKLGRVLPAKFNNCPWGSLRTFTVTFLIKNQKLQQQKSFCN